MPLIAFRTVNGNAPVALRSEHIAVVAPGVRDGMTNIILAVRTADGNPMTYTVDLSYEDAVQRVMHADNAARG